MTLLLYSHQWKRFFVVTDEVTNQPSGYTYTRNGSFRQMRLVFFVNSEGYYLLGQRTDDTGAVVSGSSNDLNSLEPIDVNQISGTAQSTTTIRFDMNLPADVRLHPRSATRLNCLMPWVYPILCLLRG